MLNSVRVFQSVIFRNNPVHISKYFLLKCQSSIYANYGKYEFPLWGLIDTYGRWLWNIEDYKLVKMWSKMKLWGAYEMRHNFP